MTTKAPTAPASSLEPIRVIELRAENFKRLKAVRIHIGDAVTEIAGDNEQGKTSVLDAIMVVLDGLSSVPEKPIRKGAKSAVSIVETTHWTAKRTFTESGGSTLTLTAKDGSNITSPQALLDRVLGDAAFDPLAFTRMKPDEQAKALLKAAGLEDQWDAWEHSRKSIEEERTAIGRDRKRLKGVVDSIPVDQYPAEPVSVAELANEHKTASATNAENAKYRAAGKRAWEEVLNLRSEVAELEEQLRTTRERLAKGEKWCDEHGETINNLQDVPLDPIAERIGGAEEHNRKHALGVQRSKAVEEHDHADESYRVKTRALEEIEAEKSSALESTSLPIKGLAFGESGLLLDGVPFSQAAASRKIRVSVAIGLAGRPRFPLMFVRDGSLLDRKALAELHTIAEENGAQIIVERVGPLAGPIGVEIVDGSVSEERTSAG